MSVTKTYTLTVKYERDTAGLVTQKGAQGETGTVPVLSESDPEFEKLEALVLSAISGVVPISQGITSAHIVGSVSET